MPGPSSGKSVRRGHSPSSVSDFRVDFFGGLDEFSEFSEFSCLFGYFCG